MCQLDHDFKIECRKQYAEEKSIIVFIFLLTFL